MSRYSHSTTSSSLKDMRRSRDRSSLLYQSSVDRNLDPAVSLKIKQHSSSNKRSSSHNKKLRMRSRSPSSVRGYSDMLVVRSKKGGKTVIPRSTASVGQLRGSKVCPACSIPVGKPKLGTETVKCRGCNVPWHRACAARKWSTFTKSSQCPECSFAKQSKRSSWYSTSIITAVPIKDTEVKTRCHYDSQDSDVDILDDGDEIDVGGPMMVIDNSFHQERQRQPSFANRTKESPISYRKHKPSSHSSTFTEINSATTNSTTSKLSYYVQSRSHEEIREEVTRHSISGREIPEVKAIKEKPALFSVKDVQEEEDICPICDGDCTCQMDEVDVCNLDGSEEAPFDSVDTAQPALSHSPANYSFSPSPEYVSNISNHNDFETHCSPKYVSHKTNHSEFEEYRSPECIHHHLNHRDTFEARRSSKYVSRKANNHELEEYHSPEYVSHFSNNHDTFEDRSSHNHDSLQSNNNLGAHRPTDNTPYDPNHDIFEASPSPEYSSRISNHNDDFEMIPPLKHVSNHDTFEASPLSDYGSQISNHSDDIEASPSPKHISPFSNNHHDFETTCPSPKSPTQDCDDLYIDITDTPVKQYKFTSPQDIQMEDVDLSLNPEFYIKDSEISVNAPCNHSIAESVEDLDEPFLNDMESPALIKSISNLEYCQVETQLLNTNDDIILDCSKISNTLVTEPSYESMVEMTEDELDFNEDSADVSSISDADSLVALSEVFQDLEFSEDEIEEDLEERHHLREREELYLIQKVMSGTQDWDSQDEIESSPALAPCKIATDHCTTTSPSLSSSRKTSFVEPEHPWFTYNPTFLSDLLDEPPVLNSRACDKFPHQVTQTNLTPFTVKSSNIQSDIDFLNETTDPSGVSGNTTPMYPPSNNIGWNDMQLFPYSQVSFSRARLRSATLPSKLKHSSFYRPLTRSNGIESQGDSALHTGWNGAATPLRDDPSMTSYTPMNQASEPPSPGLFQNFGTGSEITGANSSIPPSTLALEDVIDVSQLTSSPALAPTHPLEPYFVDALARWERIPVTSFRQRSLPKNTNSPTRSETSFKNGDCLSRFSSAIPSQMGSMSNSPRANSIIDSFTQLKIQSHPATPKNEPLSESPSPHYHMSSPVHSFHQSKRISASSRGLVRHSSMHIYHKNSIDSRPFKSTRRQLSRNRLAQLDRRRGQSYDRLFDVRHPTQPPTSKKSPLHMVMTTSPVPNSSKIPTSSQFRRKARALVQSTRRRARQAKMAQLYGFPLEFGS